MSFLLSKQSIRKIIFIFTIFAVAKLIGLVALFFLPKYGVEKAIPKEIGIEFKKYKIAQTYNLRLEQNEQKSVQVKKDILKIDNLILLALYSDSTLSYIMFMENSPSSQVQVLGKNESYKGYRLIRVEPKRAIFERDKKQYYLSFKEDERFKNVLPIARINSESEKSDYVVKTVSREEVHEYTRNAQKIWKNIAIKETKNTAGEINGFKVLAVKKDSVFQELGLKQGDIIKSVNNKELKSYADAFNIYNNIDSYDSIKLEIIRNNQKKELEYEIH